MKTYEKMVAILLLGCMSQWSYSQTLGHTAGDFVEINSIRGSSPNAFFNKLWLVRDAGGPDWLTARLHDGIAIDISFLIPMSTTKTWWERDPYNNIQSWGNGTATYMTIKGGNVGIGTTAPSTKLAVNGDIRAKEVKVETANWPDYVFEDNYRLPDLKETAEYIQHNKRLPGMPSATEVETQGLSLGEINRKLLEKVEELTLYLIEKEKTEQLQNERIRLQDARKLNLEQKRGN